MFVQKKKTLLFDVILPSGGKVAGLQVLLSSPKLNESKHRDLYYMYNSSVELCIRYFIFNVHQSPIEMEII